MSGPRSTDTGETYRFLLLLTLEARWPTWLTEGHRAEIEAAMAKLTPREQWLTRVLAHSCGPSVWHDLAREQYRALARDGYNVDRLREEAARIVGETGAVTAPTPVA
ncbi:MAG: hypothetical protein OXH52_16185 [Gammaproteobacteria bacterium]|nr:hypothetical protein [Gammaproteobacteria bacterium]